MSTTPLWEQLAPFIEDGNDPPMNLIHGAIYREGVPAKYGKYVAIRIAKFLPSEVSVVKLPKPMKKERRPPDSRWVLV